MRRAVEVVGVGKAPEVRMDREGKETTAALDWPGNSADSEHTSAG